MKNPNRFYVYAHQRLDDNSVFYIGKGCKKRAWVEKKRNKHWKAVVKKAGHRVLIIQDKMTDTDAMTLEKYLIVFYGRADLGEGRLVNMTDGGEGVSGRIVSDATRQKMSNSLKNPSAETRQKIGEGNRGKSRTEETRQKMSEARKGKPLSEEHRKNKAAAQTGKPGNGLGFKHSDEFRKQSKERALRQHQLATQDEKISRSKKIAESCKGLNWFNDGIKTFRIKPEDALPHYKNGRLKKQK